MAQVPEDRRQHTRWPIRGVLVVEKQDQEFPIQLLDISRGGIRFEARCSFAPETLIRITLDYYPVDVPLRALVAWARPTPEGAVEHGAEFVNLPEAEQVLLRDFIDENLEGAELRKRDQ